MALQLGIQLASSQTNNYLTDAKYIRGGYLAVEDISAIDSRWYDKGEGGVIVKGTLCYDIKTETFFNYDGANWQELKFATDGDETTITLNTNEKLTLKDFGKAYYKYVAKTPESPAHYEKVEGFKAGLQPQIALEDNKLVLAWYEPNPTTVEGLQSETSALSSSVQDIAAKVGNENSGLVQAVNEVSSGLSTHVADSDIHITADERVAWNAKQEQIAAGEFIKLAEDKKTISVDFTGLVLDGGTASDWTDQTESV